MKKYSKEELERRKQIIREMSYKPSKEDIKRFLTPPGPMTEREKQGRAMVDDDFGISEEAKARRKQKWRPNLRHNGK